MIMIQKYHTSSEKKRILPWKGEAKHALKKMEMYSRVNGKVHAALTTLPKTTVIYKVVIK